MPEDSQQQPPAMAGVLGGLVDLISGEIGMAIAVVAGLFTGFKTLAAADRLYVNWWSWSLYLTAGGIFVSLAIVCRRRRR